MDETIRVFIAVELEPRVQTQLGEVITNLKINSPGKVKWSAVNNLHLTLKFLGDVNTWELSSLQQILRNSANQSHEFNSSLTHLGAFPSVNNPRVIWIGLSESRELTRLARLIEDGARKIGFSEEEKAFTPHLTLGRVKPDITRQEQTSLSNCIRSTPLPVFSPILIQSITLFQSILKPGGAVYISLYSSRFNH
jgi:2'-5' RNA ligase